MMENCSNYWFCVHQKMCHAIITSIIGLNFFHFSSLTSKLTWIFCKIDMKPIVVWRRRSFLRIMTNFQYWLEFQLVIMWAASISPQKLDSIKSWLSMGMIRPITSPIPSKSPHFSLHHQFCFWKIQQFFGTTLQWFKIIEGLYHHTVPWGVWKIFSGLCPNT